jgi:ATP-dependent DNA helicase RecG
MKELIFISSVQKELADERRAIRDFVRGDALLGQYFVSVQPTALAIG